MVASLEKSPETGKALSLPLGVVSPLWMMFAGAATAGVAYWWMTRWTRPTNLEAELATVEVMPDPVIEVVPEVVAAAVVAEPIVETAPDAELAMAPSEPPLKLRKRTPKVADAG